MPKQDYKDYRHKFSQVFRPELNAVEARRRRYRIEQTLGFLPPAPEPLPDPAEADPPAADAAAAPSPIADSAAAVAQKQREEAELKLRQKETEEARQHLANARRRCRTAMSADVSDQDTASGRGTDVSPADAAKEYHAAAKAWYDEARSYRDARFREHSAPEGGADAVRAAWEHAEAILRVAADAFSDATAEVRHEAISTEQEVVPVTAANATRLSRPFGLVLACEQAVQQQLEALGAAEIDPSLRQASYRLARAEFLLFDEAARTLSDVGKREDCRTAADAAQEEVQRCLCMWNEIRARRLHPNTSSSGGSDPAGGAPGGGAGGGSGAGGGAAPSGGRGPAGGAPRGGGTGHGGWTSGPEGLDGPLGLSRQTALSLDLVGLALSGGGIRSATFGLGVLQGLAQLRLLGMIDLLSTVSGGGYIGSWLAAWVKREGSLINVEKQLSPNRISQARAARYERDGVTPLEDRPRDEEPEPVHHLRAYSRYLSPRFGAFSPDTWTLFTIYLRNLCVNALLFLPLAVAVVLFWRLLLHGYDVPLEPDPDQLSVADLFTLRFGLTALFGIAFVMAIGCLAWEGETLFEADMHRGLRDRQAKDPSRYTNLYILLPLLLVAVTGPWIFCLDPQKPTTLRYFGQSLRPQWFQCWDPVWQFTTSFAVLSFLPSFGVRLFRWYRRRGILKNAVGFTRWNTFNARGFCANVLLVAFFGAALGSALHYIFWPLSDPAWLSRALRLCVLHSLGVPLVFGALVAAGFGEMALVGLWLTEYEREWRSRVAAYLLIGMTAWLLTAVAVVLLPWAGETLINYARAPGTLKGLFAVIWAGISGGGAWLANHGASAQGRRPGWMARAVMGIAPAVFLIGLCAGVAALSQDAAEFLAGKASASGWWSESLVADAGMASDAGTSIVGLAGSAQGSGPLLAASALFAGRQPGFFVRAVAWPKTNIVLLAAAIAVGVVFGFLISVNRFSMHMLYANRLTRCYLGASCRKPSGGSLGTPTGVHEPQPPRQVNLFTGFDPLDDFPLADLRTVGGPTPYTGPVVLINCALNCLAGDELAYQDRRADAFLMTPDWCGGRLTGYARSPRQAGKPPALYDAGSLSLGRVMTISGAAVDPNMSGLPSQLTALMTLLNTRLGWWLENPKPEWRPKVKASGPWAASEPGLALRLLWEFFGWTKEDSPYIHLSDGGHFENLGVYELVRRRCRFIVVADAGTDRVAASDNMAAMMRLIRTDFGVRVELDPARMQLGGTQAFSAWHCCVGRIRYDEVDEQAVPGLMVYLQATLTGDEPPDLLQYVSRHPSFPRQSTLNQFFDEAQFEAYRTLGHHVAMQVFGEAAASWTARPANAAAHQTEVRGVFARLREQWLPPLECASAEWVAASQAALQLEQHADGNHDLVRLGHATYPELGGGAPFRSPDPLHEFRAVSQTLQVMELAWASMKLDAFHAHPTNRGWMNTFRRWTASPAFHRFWPFLRAEYSRQFVTFCEDVLNLQATGVEPDRLGAAADVSQIARLDEQFSYEWADLFNRLDLPEAAFPSGRFLSDAVSRAVTSPLDGQPLAWLLYPQGDGARLAIACGLACVARTPRQRILEPQPAVHRNLDTEAEFVFWMRGAYRSMGIGRTAARELLRQVRQHCAYPPRGAAPVVNLVAYYPLRTATAGCRMELERWMDFFFDLRFRRERQPEHGRGSQFVILRR